MVRGGRSPRRPAPTRSPTSHGPYGGASPGIGGGSHETPRTNPRRRPTPGVPTTIPSTRRQRPRLDVPKLRPIRPPKLKSIPHLAQLSPTLNALGQQTRHELIDHAAASDENLRKLLHHLASADRDLSKGTKLRLSPEQKKASRSLARRGIPDMGKTQVGRRFQRDVAVRKAKQGEPLSFREEARAYRTLIRRGKLDRLPSAVRAQFGSMPFGPGRGQVEAFVRAQRQGRRLSHDKGPGGFAGIVKGQLEHGLVGFIDPDVAKKGRSLVYGTSDPLKHPGTFATTAAGELVGGVVLGRVGSRIASRYGGRALGRVLSRGGGRTASVVEGGGNRSLSAVERAKMLGYRAAGAEAGVEVGGSRVGRVARLAKSAEKAGGPAGPSRLGTATSVGGKAAAALGIGERTASRLGRSPASRGVRAGAGVLRRHLGKTILGAGPAAQVPSVIASGDPTQFGKAFTGRGAAIQGITSTAGKAVSTVVPGAVAKNLVQDIFSLPAQALPSIYLPIAGIVEASRGNPERLRALWADYTQGPIDPKTGRRSGKGLLPAIVSRDPKAALAAIENHPLYSGLEVAGVYAAAGRGLGAAGRGTGAKAASTGGRPALEVSPGMEPIPRPYSKNILTKAAQVARDKRRAKTPEGNIRAGAQHGLRGPERERLIRDRLTSFMGGEEAARRAGRSAVYETAKGVKPAAGEDVVAEVGQHFVLGENPATFRRSAVARADRLDAIYRERTDPSLPRDEQFTKGERALNRKLAGDLRGAAKLSDQKVQGIIEAAKTFQQEHSVHSPATQELIARHPEQITHEQARRAALIPYATEHRGHTFGLSNDTKARLAELDGSSPEAARLRSQRQLLDERGNPADYHRLEADLRNQGLESPAFLSHRQGVRGPGAHYQPLFPRGSLNRRARTGQAGREGTYDASFASIEDQLAHTFTTTQRAAAFDRLLTRFGVTGKRPETGKDYLPTVTNMDEVRKINEDPQYAKEVYGIDLPPGAQVQGVRLTPLFARARSAAGVKGLVSEAKGLDALDPDFGVQAESSLIGRWQEARSPKGEGPIALLPDTAVREIEAHLQQRSSLGKAFEAYNTGFKTVILPTSTKWFEGNMIEATMRSLFSGLTPNKYRVGKKFLDSYEELYGPEARRAFEADVIPGAHYAARNFTRKFRTSEQVAGTSEAPVFRVFEAIARAPTIRTVLRAFNAYAATIFRVNTFLERQPEIAALGKFAQEEFRRNDALWGKGMVAQRDAIKGLMKEGPGGELQVRAAKSIQDIFGNWTHNTPKMRRFLADYSPFGLWLRAATKYIFWTLPRHHPIKTAILASMEEMTQNERSKLGLDLFHSTDPGAVPSDAFGIPLSGGGVFPTSYFTSFGTASQVLGGQAGNFILPQFAQIIRGGVDWKGDKLVHPDGTPLSDSETLLTIAAMTLEPITPFSADIRRLREGGASPASGSTVFFPKTRPNSKAANSIPTRIAGLSSLDAGTVAYLRNLENLRQISVPAHAGGGSSSSDPFDHLFGGGSGSSSRSTDPFSHLFK